MFIPPKPPKRKPLSWKRIPTSILHGLKTPIRPTWRMYAGKRALGYRIKQTRSNTFQAYKVLAKFPSRMVELGTFEDFEVAKWICQYNYTDILDERRYLKHASKP